MSMPGGYDASAQMLREGPPIALERVVGGNLFKMRGGDSSVEDVFNTICNNKEEFIKCLNDAIAKKSGKSSKPTDSSGSGPGSGLIKFEKNTITTHDKLIDAINYLGAVHGFNNEEITRAINAAEEILKKDPGNFPEAFQHAADLLNKVELTKNKNDAIKRIEEYVNEKLDMEKSKKEGLLETLIDTINDTSNPIEGFKKALGIITEMSKKEKFFDKKFTAYTDKFEVSVAAAPATGAAPGAASAPATGAAPAPGAAPGAATGAPVVAAATGAAPAAAEVPPPGGASGAPVVARAKVATATPAAVPKPRAAAAAAAAATPAEKPKTVAEAVTKAAAEAAEREKKRAKNLVDKAKTNAAKATLPIRPPSATRTPESSFKVKKSTSSKRTPPSRFNIDSNLTKKGGTRKHLPLRKKVQSKKNKNSSHNK